MELCEQRSGLFAGQGEGHGEAAVPEPRVVGAGVANNGQVVQEGAEDFFVEPVGIRNGLPVRWRGQIVIEGRELAKAHHFANHPNGWSRAASAAMRPQKILGAAANLCVDVGKCLLMCGSITVDGGIFVGLWAMRVGENIGPSCPERDFTALDRVEHENPEEVVESVDFPEAIEVAARGKRVGAGDLEGVAVAVQAKVIRVGKPVKSECAVADNKASGFQENKLLLESGGLLRHLVGRRRAKKVTRLVRIVERRGGCC
jgi:hypothetical protein